MHLFLPAGLVYAFFFRCLAAHGLTASLNNVTIEQLNTSNLHQTFQKTPSGFFFGMHIHQSQHRRKLYGSRLV